MNKNSSKNLSVIILSIMNMCVFGNSTSVLTGAGTWDATRQQQTFAPLQAGPWGKAFTYCSADSDIEGDLQAQAALLGRKGSINGTETAGQYTPAESFASLYSGGFGAFAYMLNQYAKLYFGKLGDATQIKQRHEVLEGDANTTKYSTDGKTVIGLGSETITYPPFVAAYAPEAFFKLSGRKVLPGRTINSFQKAGVTDPYGDMGKLASYDTLGDSRTIELKTSGNEVTPAHMLGMLSQLQLATANDDGVVIDTGIGVNIPGTDSAGNPILYAADRLLALKDDIGGAAQGHKRSTDLADTLLGRIMAALAAAMPMCSFPWDALYHSDANTDKVPYQSSDTITNIEAKRLLISMWRAYNENFEAENNPLPFFRAGAYTAEENETEKATLLEIVKDLTSTDSLTRKLAEKRILGVFRKIAPAGMPNDNFKAILAEKNPAGYDTDVFLSVDKYENKIAIAVADLTNISATTNSDLIAALDALIKATNTDKDKVPGFKFLKYVAQVNKGYTKKANDSATATAPNGFTDRDLANAGKVATLMKQFTSYIRALDPATMLNNELLDAAKLLRNTKLTLFLPGKKVKLHKNDTELVDAKYANNKQAWVVDYEAAYDGSTFGTTLGNSGVSGDARKALMIIADACRLVDGANNSLTSGSEKTSFNTKFVITDYSSLSNNDITGWSQTLPKDNGTDLKKTAFKYALDCLRFGYSACSARFNEIMKVLDAEGVTWEVKPTSLLECFMYGGKNINWHNDTTSSTKGTGTARTAANDSSVGVKLAGIAKADSKAWMVGNYNSTEQLYEANNGAMPFALLPTTIKGPIPQRMLDVTSSINQFKPLSYIHTADGSPYTSKDAASSSKVLFTGELGRAWTGNNIADQGLNEMSVVAPEVLHLLETIETGVDEIQAGLNVFFVGA